MKTKNLNIQHFIPYEVEINYKRPLYNSTKLISNAEDAEKILRTFLDKNKIDLKEYFLVILLSNSNRVLGISQVAVGSTKGVIINTKEIFQLVLKSNATAIIIAHNHPSGKLTISESDKKQTQRLKKIAEIMEVNVLDHIIITSESYTSFVNEGEL